MFKSVLQIINEVQRKLGINVTATLTETKHARALLQWLNEVIAELNDFGPFQEVYREVLVTAATSVGTYTIVPASGMYVGRVYEIALQGDTAPLQLRTIEDIRRLVRLGSTGRPRQYALKGVNVSGHPNFEVYPITSTTYNGRTFDCAIYIKPPDYTDADAAQVVPYAANVVIKGLYAKALLDEAAGEATNQYQVAYQEYLAAMQAALNRLTGNTGVDTYLMPGRFVR